MTDQAEYFKWLSDMELMLRYINTKIESGESLSENEEDVLRSLFDLYEDGLSVELASPNPEGNGN